MTKGLLISFVVFASGCTYVLGFDENKDAKYEFENFIAKYSGEAAHVWSRVLAPELNPASFALDSAGNIVMVGTYVGSPDLGGGPIIDGGAQGLFVAKLGADGTHIWSIGFGPAHPEHDGPPDLNAIQMDIAIDIEDDIAITGSFSTDTLDFGDGPLPHGGSDTLPDIFLAKLDDTGELKFLKSFRGYDAKTKNAESADYGHAVETDGSGNIYLAASASKDVNIDPKISVSGAFLAAFDPDGNTLWARPVGRFSGDFQLAISENRDVLLSGSHMGPVDLGGGELGEELGEFEFATFVAKYDGNGTHLHSMSFGANGSYFGFAGGGAAFDADGNIVVAGTEQLPVFESVALNNYRIFLRKIAPDGSFIFNKYMEFDTSRFIPNTDLNAPLIDADGNIVLFGLFTGTLKMADGPTLGEGRDGDAFFAKFDPDGSHLFSIAFERAIPPDDASIGYSLPLAYSFVTTDAILTDDDSILFMSGSPRSTL